MFNLTQQESSLLQQLNSPRKIQDFINKIPINFEPEGDTCLSPRQVLQQNRAHCIEGALLAALILRIHGHPSLVVDLTAAKKDFDHVIAVFQQHGHWGAISKTNHAVLRYREPVYKTIRELAMSFFHEYFTDEGKKTLRSYSDPVDLSQFDHKGWVTAEKNLWYINDHLAKVQHYTIVSRAQIATLRKADPIEIKIGKVVEWKKKG